MKGKVEKSSMTGSYGRNLKDSGSAKLAVRSNTVLVSPVENAGNCRLQALLERAISIR